MLPHLAKADKDVLASLDLDQMLNSKKVVKFLSDNFEHLPVNTPPSVLLKLHHVVLIQSRANQSDSRHQFQSQINELMVNVNETLKL